MVPLRSGRQQSLEVERGVEEDLKQMECWFVGYELCSVVSTDKMNKKTEKIMSS